MGAALLTLGSCTNEINEEGFVDKANTISFNAYPNKTRAVEGDVTNDNMKDDNFGVFGYFRNSPYLYVLSEGSAKKAVEQKWNTTSSTWEYVTPSELKFWPDGSMDFYAYFPSSENVTFEESNANANANSNVMTISNVNCSHDVLFAQKSTIYKDRVPLTFDHAFSKIQGLNIKVNGGNVADANVQVIVSNIEFINTSTSGNVIVNNEGKATYSVAQTNVPLTKSFPSAQTIDKSVTSGVDLISSSDNCYLFATNGRATKNVTGTNKTMWDGQQSSLNSGKLSGLSNLVCLKLTCKVKDQIHYLVGSETENEYGVVYIPLTGTHNGTTTNLSAFEPGKRYTFNIVFTHNVGFKDNGDPILRPILFNASVTGWEDVTVTITL